MHVFYSTCITKTLPYLSKCSQKLNWQKFPKAARTPVQTLSEPKTNEEMQQGSFFFFFLLISLLNLLYFLSKWSYVSQWPINPLENQSMKLILTTQQSDSCSSHISTLTNLTILGIIPFRPSQSPILCLLANAP